MGGSFFESVFCKKVDKWVLFEAEVMFFVVGRMFFDGGAFFRSGNGRFWRRRGRACVGKWRVRFVGGSCFLGR